MMILNFTLQIGQVRSVNWALDSWISDHQIVSLWRFSLLLEKVFNASTENIVNFVFIAKNFIIFNTADFVAG